MKAPKESERYVSLGLVIGFSIWDAYCQAHQVPYEAPKWLIGIMLWPFGEDAYRFVRTLPDKVKRLVRKKP